MDNLIPITLNALKEYFNILKYGGYLNKWEVHKVLILSFIEEILEGKFFDYITESDYNTMINSIYKMIPNSCTIKFPSYNVYSNLVNEIRVSPKVKYANNKISFSEDNEVRAAIQ